MATASQNGVTVTVRNLRRNLGGQPVLQGVSFEVQAGEVFVLMGPSGSGKTVLLKHLVGLERPDEGDILIEGHSVESEGMLERYRTAMVFQSGALFNSLTVSENVGLYLTEHQLKPAAEIARVVSEKLALVGLGGEEHRYPAELSGGMKKRVAIARALIIEPQLILYDEPTSELDPLMAAVVAEAILELRRRIGVTSVVVTHDRDLAFGVADRIALLDRGRILALGTPGEVRHSPDPLVQRFITIKLGAHRASSAP